MKAAVRDGTPIDYALHAGRVAAPRLVLVHSLGLDRSVWDGVIDLLGDEAEILTFDCRGHGASGKPTGPYRIGAFADDLADLMDAVGWDRALVAGSSMGGSVALRFATSHPKRVGGLALFDTTAWYGPEAGKNWNERATNAETDGLGSMLAFQETRWFGDAFRAAHPDVVARAKAIFLRNDVRAYAATCRMLGAFDLREEVRAIAVPTEIVVGEEDYATPPEMARALAEAIPGARLRVLRGARHLTTLETPADVAAAIRRVMGRAVAAAAELRANR